MTFDANLIYNALLRSERKLEAEIGKPENANVYESMLGAFVAVSTLREEVGKGMASESR